MSGRCCAFTHCTNNATKIIKWKKTFCDLHNINFGSGSCVCDPPFKLFPFPTIRNDISARQKWTSIVNRKNGADNWLPNEDSRICSIHFVDGGPTPLNPYPSLNLGYTPVKPITSRKPPVERNVPSLPKKRKSLDASFQKLQENVCSDHDYCSSISKCELCEIKDEKIKELEAKIKHIEIKPSISTSTTVKRFKGTFKTSLVLKSDKKIRFYTGLPSVAAFNAIYSSIEPHVNKIKYWKGPSRVCNPLKYKTVPSKKRLLTAKEEIILCLMKLRLGLLNEDLADRFGISTTHVTNIFTTWVKILSKVLGVLIFNPPAEIVKGNLPPKFKTPKYQNVRHIIDCSEIFIEKPTDLEAASSCWSDYKHHYTVKYLVSITPAGFINFVSKCYGGRTSDRFITEHSGFLDIIDPYDTVMADRGFQMREEFALLHSTLLIPPGRCGVSQMSAPDVKSTNEIANRRIYVEQAIRRMKFFRILKYEVPLTLLSHIDDIVKIIAGICNMYTPLPKY